MKPPLTRPEPPPHHAGFSRPLYLYELLDYAHQLITGTPSQSRRIRRAKHHNTATTQAIIELAEQLEMAAYALRAYDYQMRKADK